MSASWRKEGVPLRYRAFVISTAGTSLRRSEAFVLTPEHLHLLQGESVWSSSSCPYPGAGVRTARDRSQPSESPIPPVIAEALCCPHRRVRRGPANPSPNVSERPTYSAKQWHPFATMLMRHRTTSCLTVFHSERVLSS